MRREFIQELRGDSRREAIDIYDHIDLKELKEAYWRRYRSWGLNFIFKHAARCGWDAAYSI